MALALRRGAELTSIKIISPEKSFMILGIKVFPPKARLNSITQTEKQAGNAYLPNWFIFQVQVLVKRQDHHTTLGPSSLV